MSQAALARRLGVSPAAIHKLEIAETHGGITTGKLAEIAVALDCTLVYALVPRSTLTETVMTRARSVAKGQIKYVARTMALEDQGVGGQREREALDRYAKELIATRDIWRDTARLGKSS
jgi:predicted DNA-binding mobile mystery protein A